MPQLTIHPTVCLFVWLLLLLVVQLLSGTALAAALLLLPALGGRVLQRGGNLVRRARWLLLSMLIVFSWGIPGEPLWNGALPPTQEGLFEGLTHLGRLILVLMAVAAFLEAMPLHELLAATHALFGPLRRLGFDPDRSVVRLMLVLRYVETLPRPRDWRSLLDMPETNPGDVIEIRNQPFRWPDFIVVLTLATGTLLYLYR